MKFLIQKLALRKQLLDNTAPFRLAIDKNETSNKPKEF